MTFGGFSIDRDNFDGTVRLVLIGELDVAHVDRLKAEVDSCPEQKKVLVDTTELTFIDSTGLGAIVAARKRLGPERFELIPGEAVRRILEISGTDDYLLD